MWKEMKPITLHAEREHTEQRVARRTLLTTVENATGRPLTTDINFPSLLQTELFMDL